VTLREEREPGSNVLLDYTVAGGARRKPTLGFPVRRQIGRRWEWDDDALERARDAADDRSASLRLARMREEVLTSATLTFAAAVDLFTDPVNGALPKDERTARGYVRNLTRWMVAFGADTPWNRITPAMVQARVRERVRAGQVPQALNEARVLRILTRWLRGPARIRGLDDPMEGFPWKKLGESHTPKRPRYTRDDLAAIVKVRREVDPRFALYLALMDDSGARSKAVRIVMRSAVDFPLDRPPSPDDAPHGWILFPALKGQKAPLHLLTAFERRELDIAFAGYLKDLEARWQAERVDYPLFPGARLADKKLQVIGIEQGGALRRADATVVSDWLRDAEKLADVPHVRGRGYHGIRRTVSDLLYEELGMDGLTTALGWSTRATPEQIYVDHRRMPDRVKAREAMERKRGDS
jgi:integrase